MADPRITIQTADITSLNDVHAIVNAANDRLEGGSGVCGAIFKKAGWEDMQEMCNVIPADEDGVRCPTGEAVTTGSGDLETCVIHAVGPIYDSSNPGRCASQLIQTYWSAIRQAVQHGFKRVAFPALSCGIYGYPLEDAAILAVTAVGASLKIIGGSIEEVRFVFLPIGDGPKVQAAFQKALDSL